MGVVADAGAAAVGGADVERKSSGIGASMTRMPTSVATASAALVRSESEANVSSILDIGDCCCAL